MPHPLADMVEQALQLSAEDRARLADHLLRSLNAEVDPGIEAAWAQVAETRRQAILAGDGETVSGEAVVSRLRARRDR